VENGGGIPGRGGRTGLLAPVVRRLAPGPGLALRGLLGLVYPPVCIACGAATGSPHGLCAGCWTGMRFIERPWCERLGTPFAVDLGVPGLISPAAMAAPPVFARARSVARYDDTARRLVHRLKYEDRLDLAVAMGRMMARTGRDLVAEADAIVPVPLWRWRLWRRRFNQAALLARHVAAGHGRTVEAGLLLRVRRTRPQVGLSRPARAENLQGAFRVPEAARPRLAGRRILLVDDVMTTGATANAAARALLRGGAASVDVLTFACVVGDGAT
jgi:ComF family protein